MHEDKEKKNTTILNNSYTLALLCKLLFCLSTPIALTNYVSNIIKQ